MNNISPVVVLVIVVALLVAVTAKFILFGHATRRRTIGKWFFFDRISIVDSSSRKSRQYKIAENILSMLMLIFVVVFLLYVAIINA